MPDDGLYRKESLEHITNPQQLDNYIVVTRPGWWFLVCALIVLLVCVFIWASVGSIPETVDAKAVVIDETHLVCYLPVADTNTDMIGKQVTVSVPRGKSGTYAGLVYSVSPTPYSRQEVADTITSDWLLSNLVTSNYVDKVTIVTQEALPVYQDSLCDVTILVAQLKPIHYITH